VAFDCPGAVCYNAGSYFTEVVVYAIIRSGGKQYRVAEGQTVRVERDVLGSANQDKITFGEVLMIGGDEPKIGKSKVAGASVEGEIVGEAQGKKLVVFKFRKRKRSRKKAGHRQSFTAVKILSVKG